jgi:hypothetical protein
MKKENARLAAEFKSLQVKNELLETNNRRLGDECMKLHTQLQEASQFPVKLRKEVERTTMFRMIGEAILAVCNIVMYRTQAITRLRTLCNIILDGRLFGNFATDTVMKEVCTRYARKSVFVPWKVLRSIDLAINGGINYTGLESLRAVEELEKNQYGCLPSRSAVQQCAYQLQELGQNVVTMERVPSNLGECYQFNFEKQLRFLLQAFSLHDLAQRESVEICITLDGAELTKDLCHLSFGVKITDGRAKNPRDGLPLAYSEDGIFGKIFNVQSRNYCFIMKTLLGRDSKQAYNEFSDVFRFFERVMSHGLPCNENGPRIMPVNVWSPQDLSSIWKSLNTGGGARKCGDKHWCHLCACTGNKIASYKVEGNRSVLWFFDFYTYLFNN